MAENVFNNRGGIRIDGQRNMVSFAGMSNPSMGNESERKMQAAQSPAPNATPNPHRRTSTKRRRKKKKSTARTFTEAVAEKPRAQRKLMEMQRTLQDAPKSVRITFLTSNCLAAGVNMFSSSALFDDEIFRDEVNHIAICLLERKYFPKVDAEKLTSQMQHLIGIQRRLTSEFPPSLTALEGSLVHFRVLSHIVQSSFPILDEEAIVDIETKSYKLSELIERCAEFWERWRVPESEYLHYFGYLVQFLCVRGDAFLSGGTSKNEIDARRAKFENTIDNVSACLALQEKFSSFHTSLSQIEHMQIWCDENLSTPVSAKDALNHLMSVAINANLDATFMEKQLSFQTRQIRSQSSQELVVIDETVSCANFAFIAEKDEYTDKEKKQMEALVHEKLSNVQDFQHHVGGKFFKPTIHKAEGNTATVRVICRRGVVDASRRYIRLTHNRNFCSMPRCSRWASKQGGTDGTKCAECNRHSNRVTSQSHQPRGFS